MLSMRRLAGSGAALVALALGVLAGPALGGPSSQNQEQQQRCTIITGLTDAGPCPTSEQSEEQTGTGTNNQAQEQEQRQCFLCLGPP